MKFFGELPKRPNSDNFLGVGNLAARLLAMLLIFKAATELGKEDRIRAS